MTALTAAAAPRTAAGARLAALGWNTVRQHRLALIGLAIVFAGFGLRLVLTGIPLHSTYAQYLSHNCAGLRNPACGRLLDQMSAPWVTGFGGMAVLPGLIGVLVGAPLVARDFETGPYRFGFAQGVSGRRQLVAQAAASRRRSGHRQLPARPAHDVVPGAISPDRPRLRQRDQLLAARLLQHHRRHAPGLGRSSISAWGVLAGALIKRSVPAMAVTLAARDHRRAFSEPDSP